MPRKRKVEGVDPVKHGEVLPEARFVRPLRRPADVTMERKRLYRSVINGRVSVDDAARLSYILTAVRNDLEADQSLDVEQAPGGYFVSTVNIHGVPSGTFLPAEEIKRLESQFAEPPLEAPAPDDALVTRAPPFLRVHDNADVDVNAVDNEAGDPEPSSAA